MPIKSPLLISLGLIAAMWALSAWAWPHLPADHIATHFDASGAPNGWSPRPVVVNLTPGIALLVTALMAIAPGLMPKRGDLTRSAEAYAAVWIATTGLLALVHTLLLLKACGLPIDPVRPVIAASGLLIMVIGNFLPKTRFNYMMGIRTPWTLADERVWDRTHRFAGPLMVTSGAALAGLAWFLPTAWTLGLLLVCLAPSVVAPALYSYLVARKLGAA